MYFLYFLLGCIVLSSILGPVAARYVSPRPRVSYLILAALVTPALLLVATAYLSSVDSVSELEKVVVFGVVFAGLSLLVGLVTSTLVIVIAPTRAEGGRQRRSSGETATARALLGGWIASVLALASALLYMLTLG